jgi:hypothetical protein
MSDFDPKDIIDEKAPVSDFDAQDIVNDSEISPQIEQTEEQPVEVSGIPIVEPVVGYASGRAAQEAISKTGELANKGLEKIAQMGGTSPEQLKVIKENFPAFKATDPIAEMNKLLKAARGTNVGINQMFDEAEKLLADKKITPDEYKSLVEKAILEQDKYNQPTFAKPISQSEVFKTLQPAIEKTQQIVKTKQEQMLEEFADLKAKEAVAQASERSLGQLPKKTAEQIEKSTKEQILQNPQAFDFSGMSAQEALPIFQEQREKLLSGKETALADTFPSLKGTSIVPTEEKTFQKILGMPSTADIPGYQLQEFYRTMGQKAFTEEGQLSDKPSAAVQTQIRQKIGELSPEAGTLMEKQGVEINKLKSLEDAGYIKRNETGLKTTIEMTDSQRNKLIKDLSNVYDKASPTDVVENLQALKDYLPEIEFKKLQMAGLKLAEKRSGGVDYINTNKLNAILQSITKRSVSRAVATLPEAVSTALPKTAMVSKLLGKTAVKALPVLGAGIGGIAAQAAEEAASPETSGATPDMPEYWLERGVRNPEEQIQKARLASFKQELPMQGKMDELPSAYEKPEIKQRKEQVLQAKKAGALAPTYVEAPKAKVLKADNPAEIAGIAQALQSNADKASQEYGRVLSQIVDAPMREKESILFGLNQQPAFRELVRKLKGQTEE